MRGRVGDQEGEARGGLVTPQHLIYRDGQAAVHVLRGVAAAVRRELGDRGRERLDVGGERVRLGHELVALVLVFHEADADLHVLVELREHGLQGGFDALDLLGHGACGVEDEDDVDGGLADVGARRGDLELDRAVGVRGLEVGGGLALREAGGGRGELGGGHARDAGEENGATGRGRDESGSLLTGRVADGDLAVGDAGPVLVLHHDEAARGDVELVDPEALGLLDVAEEVAVIGVVVPFAGADARGGDRHGARGLGARGLGHDSRARGARGLGGGGGGHGHRRHLVVGRRHAAGARGRAGAGYPAACAMPPGSAGGAAAPEDIGAPPQAVRTRDEAARRRSERRMRQKRDAGRCLTAGSRAGRCARVAAPP